MLFHTKHTLPFAMLLLMLASSCDFPADPPMKISDGTVTPPVADTVRVLLPLTGHEHWTYFVDPRNKPLSAPRTVKPRPLERGVNTYFYLPYLYMTGPVTPLFAYPTLLRNDTLGLAFYLPGTMDDTTRLSREPKFMFRLPYPARKGSVSSSGDYRVICTHTDAMMTILSTGLKIPTYRYEIFRGSAVQTVMHIIPGVALLRIDVEDMTFHTVSWQI